MITVALGLMIVLSLAFSAFCSGVETCMLSVSRERILHLTRAGGRKAWLVQQALTDMARTTTTILIGNNLANVVYATASAALIADCCADSVWRSAWSFLAAFTVLYTAEFMPKLLCAARPLRRVLVLAPAYQVMAVSLRPLVALAMRFTNLFMSERKEVRYKLTTADLMRILQDRKDGVCLSDFESALIGRILVLRIKQKPITTEALLSALRELE